MSGLWKTEHRPIRSGVNELSERWYQRVKRAIPMSSSKKALPAVFAGKAFLVETTGIEPVTSGLQSQRSPN